MYEDTIYMKANIEFRSVVYEDTIYMKANIEFGKLFEKFEIMYYVPCYSMFVV